MTFANLVEFSFFRRANFHTFGKQLKIQIQINHNLEKL